MNRLIIIGASGHGKVIADIALRNGYTDIVFLDDNENIKECAGFPVIGVTSEAPFLDGDKIVAIGNEETREKIQSEIETVTLIHPNAVIGRRVKVGEGSVIMAGAVINPGAKICRGVIVNTCSSVDHDCVLKDFCHIGVGAHLAGTVIVGETSFVGVGTAVINNITIGDGVTVGAGAAVVKNLTETGTYVGVPARKIK